MTSRSANSGLPARRAKARFVGTVVGAAVGAVVGAAVGVARGATAGAAEALRWHEAWSGAAHTSQGAEPSSPSARTDHSVPEARLDGLFPKPHRAAPNDEGDLL
ncbi:hypothetical protein ABT072_08035 [Streptomyces sp. NPDC002589]|uniref:hypothetical protein n=1 Tax=Streptomyces sp. NPDC002589 TaxID=3154420 RepID=UPI00332CE32B